MESSNRVAMIKASLRYKSREEFIEGMRPLISGAGLFIRTKSTRQVGTEVQVEFSLSDGSEVYIGEGVVRQEVVASDSRALSGILIGLKKVNRPFKEVMDVILGSASVEKAEVVKDSLHESRLAKEESGSEDAFRRSSSLGSDDDLSRPRSLGSDDVQIVEFRADAVSGERLFGTDFDIDDELDDVFGSVGLGVKKSREVRKVEIVEGISLLGREGIDPSQQFVTGELDSERLEEVISASAQDMKAAVLKPRSGLEAGEDASLELQRINEVITNEVSVEDSLGMHETPASSDVSDEVSGLLSRLSESMEQERPGSSVSMEILKVDVPSPPKIPNMPETETPVPSGKIKDDLDSLLRATVTEKAPSRKSYLDQIDLDMQKLPPVPVTQSFSSEEIPSSDIKKKGLFNKLFNK